MKTDKLSLALGMMLCYMLAGSLMLCHSGLKPSKIFVGAFAISVLLSYGTIIGVRLAHTLWNTDEKKR